MYPIAITIIIGAIMSALSISTAQNIDVIKYYQYTLQRQKLVMVAEGLEQYYLENGSYPANLSTLAATSGYEYMSSILNNWQGYAVSGILADGIWQYKRMAVFSADPSKGSTPTIYTDVNNNSCGTGAFASASSWCGNKNSIWYKKETREIMNDAVSTQRAKLNRTLQKFGDAYTANSAFPSVDAGGTALTAGNTYLLATLAGYAGTAKSCVGEYSWNGIPIGCDDMFDAWGGPIGVAYTSPDAIALTSETPLVNASGIPLVVAAGFTM